MKAPLSQLTTKSQDSDAVARIRTYVDYPYTSEDTAVLVSQLVTITAGDLRALLAERDALAAGATAEASHQPDESACKEQVRKALAAAHRAAALCGEQHAGGSSSTVTDAICAALRALDVDRIIEGTT